ncbi:hypothetical protein ACRAWG_15745 [Methylobacterium sp. P31]
MAALPSGEVARVAVVTATATFIRSTFVLTASSGSTASGECQE